MCSCLVQTYSQQPGAGNNSHVCEQISEIVMEYARIRLPCIVQLNACENTVRMDEPGQSHTVLPDSTHKMLKKKKKSRLVALVGIGEKENKKLFFSKDKIRQIEKFWRRWQIEKVLEMFSVLKSIVWLRIICTSLSGVSLVSK